MSVEGPFSVVSEALVLASGERRELLVSFAPPVVGLAQGALVLRSPAGEERIALKGEGRERPECSAPRACVRIHFDPDTGACLENAIDEGRPCEDACLGGAHCRAGECVGKPRECSDGNACTDDLCEPGIGCQHVEIRCAEPENPCQVAICDATQGCLTANVEDGTPCGEQACQAAHVCLGGTCSTRKLPEGAGCGAESPCQAAGVCRAEQCVQPPAVPLLPSWTVPVAPGAYVRLFGPADEEGNLYWIEAPLGLGASPPPPTTLVSATRDGVLRYRTSISPALSKSTLLKPAGNVIVLSGLGVEGAGHLAAHRRSNGELLWTTSNDALSGAEDSRSWLMEFDGRDTLYLSGERTAADGTSDVLMAVSATDGKLQWRTDLRGSSGNFSVDRWGNLYVIARHGHVGELRSYTPEGTLRWQRADLNSGPHQHVLQAGRLTFFDGRVMDANDGRSLGPVTFEWALPQDPNGHTSLQIMELLGSGDSIVALAHVRGFDGDWKPWNRYQLSRVSNSTGVPLSRAELSLPDSTHSMAQFVLTSRGTLLFQGIPRESGTGLLHEVELGGRPRFTCPLGLPEEAYFSSSFLAPERWVGAVVDGDAWSLVGFEVAGLAPATKGWSGRDQREH